MNSSPSDLWDSAAAALRPYGFSVGSLQYVKDADTAAHVPAIPYGTVEYESELFDLSVVAFADTPTLRLGMHDSRQQYALPSSPLPDRVDARYDAAALAVLRSRLNEFGKKPVRGVPLHGTLGNAHNTVRATFAFGRHSNCMFELDPHEYDGTQFPYHTDQRDTESHYCITCPSTLFPFVLQDRTRTLELRMGIHDSAPGIGELIRGLPLARDFWVRYPNEPIPVTVGAFRGYPNPRLCVSANPDMEHGAKTLARYADTYKQFHSQG